ncbi:MAG: hypothetical protein ACK559_37305, partial [bacterium]
MPAGGQLRHQRQAARPHPRAAPAVQVAQLDHRPLGAGHVHPDRGHPTDGGGVREARGGQEAHVLDLDVDSGPAGPAVDHPRPHLEPRQRPAGPVEDGEDAVELRGEVGLRRVAEGALQVEAADLDGAELGVIERGPRHRARAALVVPDHGLQHVGVGSAD